MLDVPIYSGFSIDIGGSLWARLMSAGIRWFTGSPDASHAFLVYWRADLGCWMTVGANNNGVTEIALDKFQRTRKITHIFRPIGFSLMDGFRKHVDDLGKPYAFTAILDMAFVEIAERLHRHPRRNLLELRGELFCSQWIAEVIKDALGTFQWMRWPLINTSASIIDPGLLCRTEKATTALWAEQAIESLRWWKASEPILQWHDPSLTAEPKKG